MMTSAAAARRLVAWPVLLLIAAIAAPIAAQTPDRKVLDHDAYATWRTIQNQAVSADGRWVLYVLSRDDGDGELVVREAGGETEHRVPRGSAPRFTRDGGHAVFLIRPGLEQSRDARRENLPSAEQPKDSLGILELATGSLSKIAGVRSFRLPDERSQWLVYHHEPASSARPDTADAETAAQERAAGQGRGGARGATAGAARGGRSGNRDGDAEGRLAGELVLRDLRTGDERRFESATAYALSADGQLLVYAAWGDEEGGAGVFSVDAASGTRTQLEEGRALHRQLAADESGQQAAFLRAPLPADSAADGAAEPADYVLHHWRRGEAAARAVAAAGTAGVPAGWRIGENGTVEFSKNGRRLYFGTALELPRAPEPERRLLAEEQVRVDVWHWQDPDLMTAQLVQADRERRRTHLAVVHVADGDRVVQLATEDVPDVTVADHGNGDIAVGRSNGPYRDLASWDFPRYQDAYVVDVRDGQRRLAVQQTQGNPALSPDAHWLYWYEPRDSAWHAVETAGERQTVLSEAIPHAVHNEDHDTPSAASAYGVAGWTEGDGRVLIYDRYDIWAVDPRATARPENVTRDAGRRDGVRYRRIRLDPDESAITRDEPLLLSAFHERTKDAGFSRGSLRGATPEQIVLTDRSFSTPVRSRDADIVLYTRESFREFPDLWVSDAQFRSPHRVSDANPQQAEYRWGNAELVEWRSADGVPLQGVLMTPEDLDPARTYPMVVYFYERWSDDLHSHYAPVAHRSRISFPMYTSQDYLVFIPDIVYRSGYPGESALNAIVPGVLKLAHERPYVDAERIALQGHSWGGYQIAFIVTRSQRLFRAAAAGAPVANMTSAYGGIRRETGLVRQFQYERTQSRLGGNLWDMPVRFIENSPLFWVDKVETPLLILHNDRDGHVPWEQGIELFVALRRLSKPAWLINYNDEPHWPTTFANRKDWNIRMLQFFDHYLKDAPMPVWMATGIPALEKGTTLGLELIGEPVTQQDGGARPPNRP